MAWVDGKAFRFFLPALADVLIRRKSLERFESLCEIIGHQKGIQMLFQVVMGVVVILFGSIRVPGSYVSKRSSSAPNNALPRRLTL